MGPPTRTAIHGKYAVFEEHYAQRGGADGVEAS